MGIFGLRYPGEMFPTESDTDFQLAPDDPLTGCSHHDSVTGVRWTEWRYLGLMNVLYRCTRCDMEWSAFDEANDLARIAADHGDRSRSDA